MGYKPNINDVLDRWEEFIEEEKELYNELYNGNKPSSNPTKCGSNVSQISYLPNNELFFKINEVS